MSKAPGSVAVMVCCHCHGVKYFLRTIVSVLEQILCLALCNTSKKKNRHFIFSYVLAIVLATTTKKTVIDCWPDFTLV